MAIPLTQLPCDARCVAKGRLVAGMDAGLSWRAAAAAAGITISEATAHRLRRCDTRAMVPWTTAGMARVRLSRAVRQ